MQFSGEHEYFCPSDGSGVVAYSQLSGNTHFIRGSFTTEMVQPGKSIDCHCLRESLGLEEQSFSTAIAELAALGVLVGTVTDGA